MNANAKVGAFVLADRSFAFQSRMSCMHYASLSPLTVIIFSRL